MINFRSVTSLALALAVAPVVLAQESTGQIAGTLKTKDGAPIAGAIIRLTSPALQGARTVTTDERGNFRAPLLPPGSYTITTTKEGYAIPRTEAEVGLGQVVRRDILAALVGASAVVEVIATAATVDKSDTKGGTLITSDDLDVLPRFTRGLQDIALLSPGVTTGIAGRPTIRGSQTTGNRFLLNGTDIADNIFNVSQGRQYFVDDSISEIQVLQSPVHARYGNFTGGVVNAITKSGGNEFTGILRANLSRTDWSAQAPRGLRPAVAPSNAGNTNGEDILNRAYTLIIGGPIIKDMWWFSVSTKKNPITSAQGSFLNAAGLNNSDGSTRLVLPTEGQAYTQISDLKFWELKTTFAINQNHTLELSANDSKSTATNQVTGNTFDPDTLYNRQDENKYTSFGYRALFGNSVTFDARWARKIDTILSGGLLNRPRNQRIDVLLSNGAYYRFNNATFSAVNPLERNASTLTANLTYFTPQMSIGTMTFDLGFEKVRTGQKSDNAQSPTGTRMFLSGINPDGTYRAYRGLGPAGDSNIIELSYTSAAEAASFATSGWLNDTWAINDTWQVMLGLRYDQAKASDTLGSPTVESNRISKRLQITWDPFKDQSWIFRGHFAEYVGRLHDGFLTKFTYSGNPLREQYIAKASNTSATYSQVTDLAFWDLTANGFAGAFGGPTSHVNKGLKAPYAEEGSLSARHNWKDGSFLQFSLSRRTWHDFYNDFNTIGGQYQLNSLIVPGLAVTNVDTYWDNDSRLVRHYNNMEIEFLNMVTPKWQFGGNYTYSTLKGNGEGGDSGGANVASVGDPLGDFDAVHTANGRDASYYAPYGYLIGDQRHKASMYLNYISKSEKGGIFTSSILLNYASGASYSLTRSTAFGTELRNAALAAGLSASDAALYQQFYPNYTRYFGPRGLGRFNDTFNFDLKMGVDVPLWRRVRWFGEVTVFNVFNHWQQATFSTATNTGSLPTTDPKAGYWASAWSTSATNRTGWGTYGSGDFVGGRSVRLSTGIKW